MSEIFNMYCDESRHVEHDRQKAMVLGTASWVYKRRSDKLAT